MKYALSVATATLFATTPAMAAPGSSDQIMVWRMYQLAPDTVRDRHDVTFYLIKQHWLTDDLGVYAFWTPVQAGVLRGAWRFKPAGDLGVTLMAGARWSGLGASLKTFGSGFLEGPEGAFVLSHPLGGGFGLSAMGSYAHLFELNPGPAATPNTGEMKNLTFYAVNLNFGPIAGTTVTAGVLGSILNGYQTGQKFHDLGPTLTLSHGY
jgi:hypothetical protein